MTPERRVTRPTNWKITGASGHRDRTGPDPQEWWSPAQASMIRDRLSDVHVRAAGASSIIEGDVNPR